MPSACLPACRMESLTRLAYLSVTCTRSNAADINCNVILHPGWLPPSLTWLDLHRAYPADEIMFFEQGALHVACRLPPACLPPCRLPV